MPRTLNFRQIEAFRAVMQTGTTTAAADMLHTTQPSVSRLLAQMQNATGLKLFDIQKGRLRPTHEARQLFETVQCHFLGLARIEQDIAVLRKLGTGTLRLGCTPALGLSVLPLAIHAFTRQFPEVHVDLQTLSAHQLREGLLHGRHDLVVSTMALSHPEFDAVSLHRSHAVCVMHPDHPFATRKSVHARELQDQVLITLNTDDEIFLQLQTTLQSQGVEALAKIETTYSATICMMAAQGTGVGIVNPYVASVFRHVLKMATLKPLCPVEVVLAFPNQTAPSVLADCFANMLRRQFSVFNEATFDIQAGSLLAP